MPHRTSRFVQRAKEISICAITLAFSSCASVDFDYPKPETRAVDPTLNSRLHAQIAAGVEQHPSQSGFRLLTDGIDALAVRLLMADRAQYSIDAQYYLITNDLVGSTFIASLLKAADRGVRVRLLLDDIQTSGYDAGMAALDSHPNFEVRIFNPFAGRSSRVGDGLGNFRRVNRRMHNKSFTADNQVSLIGGRNIAAEYFAARADVNFGDVDVLAVGPVAQDVSAMFDSYWNHETAAAVPAFAKMPEDPAQELVELRARLAAAVAEIRETDYADAVRSDVDANRQRDLDDLTWSSYTLAYDSPDKAIYEQAEDAASILVPLDRSIQGAKRELIVVSPYFVPQRSGIEYLTKLEERGVEVVIITNSLAATNQAVVHSGYAPSRKPLLEQGVQIYEVRSDAWVSGVRRGGSGASKATLHTKLFVVDRTELFVGSFNWDPRSARINTELGVIIDSPKLGGVVARRIDEARNVQSYEVVLNEKGRLRWVDRSGSEPVYLDKEPQASFWRRFTANFMRIFPISGQL